MSDRFTSAGHAYLSNMYVDAYFPKAEVDKVKAQMEKLVAFLEAKPRTAEETQQVCDEIVDAINALQEDFEEAGSEIETAARESIGETVGEILKFYGVELDSETALRNRDW